MSDKPAPPASVAMLRPIPSASITDATALGTLTDAVADALALLATNAAGTAARKVAITAIVRAILQATTQAEGRAAIGAEASGTASAAVAAHVAAGDPHPQYALESALGTVSTLSYPGGTTLYLRADGTWAAAGGGSVTSTDITDSTATGRAVLTAANAAAARTAIGAVIGTDVQAYDADLTSWAAVTRASGYDTFAAVPSSANLAALLTDETGSGAAVFGTAPTIAAPVLTGTVVVRQTGGTAGTDEVQVYHDGTRGWVESKDGELRLLTPTNRVRVTSGNFSLTVDCRLEMNGIIYFRFSDKVNWGDLEVSRAASKVAGITDGSTGGGTLSSVPLTPSQITKNQNNYAPGVARYYRLSTDASRDITGLSCSQVSGQECEIWNVDANNIVLKHQDANSTAANRFICTGAADITLAADEVALLRYDSTSSRWRVRKV